MQWHNLTTKSTGQKCLDLIPVLCPLREQDETVQHLARDIGVSTSRVRTTGAILLSATAVFNFDTTGEPYDIMFASNTGALEHLVFGCNATMAKKRHANLHKATLLDAMVNAAASGE